MGLINKVADRIAIQINAKNDEVMSLTQEVDELKKELSVKSMTINDISKKCSDLNFLLEHTKIELRASKEANQLLADEINDLNKQIKSKKSLSSDVDKIKKLKDSVRRLDISLNDEVKRGTNNRKYREMYEFISDEKNREEIIDVFSHNLKKFMDENELNQSSAGHLFKVSRELVGSIVRKERSVTVNSIQQFDIKMCEYFECDVLELVRDKQ